MTSAFKPLFTLTLLAAVLAHGSANAQAQIDHTKALAGNITPGDAPGYPITLSRAGHYKLMGNLSVPAGTGGIVITAEHVTLDLNGFSVNGSGSCTHNPATMVVTCSGVTPFLKGIYTVGHTRVLNGTVRGFGIGMQLDEGGVVERVTVTQNSAEGIYLNPSWATFNLDRVSAHMNGGNGIYAPAAVVRNSQASANGGRGILGNGHQNTRVFGSHAMFNRMLGYENLTLEASQSSTNGLSNRNAVSSAGQNSDSAGIY